MSVTDSRTVDALGMKDREVTLCIFDHLPWDDDIFETHIIALRNKLNDYLDFLRGHQIDEHYSQDQYDRVVVCVVSKFEPCERAGSFINDAKAVFRRSGFFLEWTISPGSGV